jgi:ABC-type Fe3+-hydroxamate transport system substrate-binding protein
MANLNQQWVIVSVLAIGLWGCNTGKPPVVSTEKGSPADGTAAAIAQSATPITNAKRTVALSSLSADILYQLDPKKLVGVAHDRRVAEHDDLSQYPNIGDGRDFDVKAILKLRPDLVVGIAGVHERVLSQLEEAGIPTQRYTLNGWDGLFETIEDLARATDSDPKPLLDRYALLRSESMADDVSQTATSADAAKNEPKSNTSEAEELAKEDSNSEKSDTTTDRDPTSDKSAIEPPDQTPTDTASKEADPSDLPTDNDRDRDSTLILASRDPLFSLNRKSWGGSAIEPFTQNIAADIDENRSAAGYVTLEPEAIAAADPDTILIVETPGSADPLADFESLPFWQDLQAVKNDRVFLVDYYGLIKPATLADIDMAIEQLTEIFDLPHRTASQLKLGNSTSITRQSTLNSRPST